MSSLQIFMLSCNTVTSEAHPFLVMDDTALLCQLGRALMVYLQLE